MDLLPEVEESNLTVEIEDNEPEPEETIEEEVLPEITEDCELFAPVFYLFSNYYMFCIFFNAFFYAVFILIDDDSI